MKKPAPQKRLRETNANALKAALVPRISRRIESTAEISFPCAPSMIDHFEKTLAGIFAHLGRTFSEAELANLRRILEKKLAAGFAESPYSRVVVKDNTEPPPHPGLSYKITTQSSSIGDEYERWVATRDPPLFGTHPDAKVMKLAAEIGPPAEVAVLDVGAGTGRNTLPLARAGHPTDAVEIAPALAAVLRKEVADAKLQVEVFEGDFLDEALPVPAGRYKLVVLAEVVASHFREPAQLRTLAERAAHVMAPGGVLLFSAFVPMDGYKPDATARQLAQIAWCSIFTRHEIERAFEGLPFERVSDDSVHDFEKEHLPAEAWPPTGWFVNWSLGGDLFALPEGRAPVEMRWLAFRRR